MQTIKLSELLDGLQNTMSSSTMLLCFGPSHGAYPSHLKFARLALEDLDRVCADLGLHVSRVQIARVRKELDAVPAFSALLESAGVSNDGAPIVSHLNGLVRGVIDETSTRFYFQLSQDALQLYGELRPFGDEVAVAFPEASSDIEEAAKCLALQRATACVFHCMRATEHGIRALIGVSFGDPAYLQKPKMTWGMLIQRVEDEQKKSDSDIAAPWKGRQARLDSLVRLMRALMVQQRNKTMHCEIAYTVEQAKDVFHATGAFVRRLAEDLGLTNDKANENNAENGTGT